MFDDVNHLLTYLIKTKPETVWYFAYWRVRDVPSGAEVAIGGCRPPGRLASA